MSNRTVIGNLKDRITFQADTGSQNSSGEVVASWGNIATDPTVWCQVIVGSTGSDEKFQKKDLTATTNVSFIIRYRTDLLHDMRVVFESDNYKIREIKDMPEMEWRKYTELVCEVEY